MKTSNWNEKSRLEDYEMYINLMNLGDFAFDPQVRCPSGATDSHNTSKDTQMMLREVIATQDRRSWTQASAVRKPDHLQTRTKIRIFPPKCSSTETSPGRWTAKANWRGDKSPVN